MKENQNMAIGFLSLSAVILLVAVLFSTTGEQGRALAFGQLDRGGDYILATGQFTQNSELIYVTDAAARRMIIYSYEPTRRQIVAWDVQDFRRVFGGP